ncbi:hypothetical protein [Anaeromyxobacter sp. SG66]|uniref:hypothetical protein n=1 Tax=Anaeromyxobacter sp. SG66 TaxID=2925410 RepID=UPI001F595797|nr:hypothetical protein [Anaeromyxobacter sp. SG66]
MPLRVRRLTGAEAERYRAPAGEALVAVLELAVSVPVEYVDGREGALVSRLQQLERGGPEAAAAFLASLNR